MGQLPLLDDVVWRLCTCQIFIAVLYFVSGLVREPVDSYLIHVFVPELAETHEQEVVIHV